MSRVSRVTTALVATALTSAVAVSAVAPAPSVAAAAKKRTPTPVTFTISSFNVLGASHTVNSKKWASGAVRIVRVNQLLERHHVDVAGFQELQASQLTKFLDITDGAWAVYPGLQLSRIDSENSIGWRTDKFDLVQATTVRIPYFKGSPRKMPLVLLREKASGMMLYVTNYHNPAETAKYHNQGRWRAEATRIEIALQKQLFNRGIPRFVTGDFNERAPFFCRFAKEAPVIAARPNTYYRDGACHANRPRAVDWILGARKVSFTNYNEWRGHLVDITTDHPVITSQATVDPARLPRAWNPTPPPPVVPKVSY
jgi:Endonuclease/Exonuclease/phosphatase family